ncbi:MAG: glycoside hydrolase family 2 protein, partial [Ignisphaera sp.]
MKSYFRPRIPLNGFWRFRVDPNDIGENNGWHKGFESEHLVYVPSSWNEQNPDWDKYVGIAWYQTKFYIGVEHIGKIPWTVFKGC